MKPIEPSELLKHIDGNPLIDVRTPAEYASGHIPGAVNIPLFSNNERVEIGTLYKQQSRKAAMLRAFEVVGPKLAGFIREAGKLSYTDHIVVHCWRGGMRSSTFAWLLNTADIPAVTLLGGYKGFRNHILSFFEQKMNIRILTGCTGSGKSDLLQFIMERGEQVVDLESLASHKGSAFGALGQNSQPTSEQFQNDLFWVMKDLDLQSPVWMEDESISIGRVYIPEPLWRQMRISPLYRVDLSLSQRINRLVDEYSQFDKAALSDAIQRISKRLGGQNTNLALEALEKEKFKEVAEILLIYYDKAYNKSIEERKNQIVFQKEYDEFIASDIASDIAESLSGDH